MRTQQQQRPLEPNKQNPANLLIRASQSKNAKAIPTQRTKKRANKPQLCRRPPSTRSRACTS